LEVNVQLHAPVALLPGKEPPVSHWIGGWVGSKAGLDDVERRKFFILPRLGTAISRLSSPQPVAIPTTLSRLLIQSVHTIKVIVICNNKM
jgi:hypothetical protein